MLTNSIVYPSVDISYDLRLNEVKIPRALKVQSKMRYIFIWRLFLFRQTDDMEVQIGILWDLPHSGVFLVKFELRSNFEYA